MIIINIKLYLKLLNDIFRGIDNSFSTIIYLLFPKDDFLCKFKYLGNIVLNKNDRKAGVIGFLIDICQRDINLNQKKELNNILSQRNEKIITMLNGVKMINLELSLICETFVLEEFDVDIGGGGENETVIDIGANRGDTALFFANKNYNVIAFEPVGKLYETAINNLDLNPHIKDRIHLVQKAVSCEKGKIKLYFNGDLDLVSGEVSQYIKGKNTEIVETTTIKDILIEYNLKPYILKMDCEGCEYDIILKSDLSMFKYIYFEYHENLKNLKHEILIEKLEKQGFELFFKEELFNVGIVKMIKK